MRDRAASLRSLLAEFESVQRLGPRLPWAANTFLFSLDAALTTFERKGDLTAALLNPTTEEGKREGWQARALRTTRPAYSEPAERLLRRRLELWPATVLRGHRCAAFRQQLHDIRLHMPPRVLSAVLRVGFNGWMTARRFGSTGSCVLGCGRADDSIEHYARCPCYHGLCRRHLRLDRPPHDLELDAFLFLRRVTRRLPIDAPPEGGPQASSLPALSVYALYRTHNSLRVVPTAGSAAELFRGYLREGARGHSPAMALLNSVRNRRLPE